MAKSAWAKFATYISFHGGLCLGIMNDGAPFVEMFRLLISEEECELGMHIPNKPTSVEKIAAAAKVPPEQAAAMLKHMSQKGACFERVTEDGRCFYNITPFIPGFYEFVMTDPETKKNAAVAYEFRRTLDELGVLLRNVSVQGGGLMKVTPVMQEISAQQKVYSYEDVMTFINKATRYSVADCACRTAAKLVGKGCEHPIEDTCLQFDDTADYYVRTGRGRAISREEAIGVLDYTERSGLVHCAFQVEGKDYTTFICNCCGCSCAGLRQINRLDANPMSHSNFRAEINDDNCVACGECVKICPVNAVVLGTKFEGGDAQRYAYRKAQKTVLKKSDVHDDFINERHLSSECGTAPCKVSCPAHVSVQGYIAKAAEGKYMEALEVIKKDNPLPAVCGRICPHPCEAQCTRSTLDQSLAIDAIKLFVADQEREAGKRFVPEKKARWNKRAAVIGSGPAGISCAYYLAVDGFDVTIFEKAEKPGGMLMLGIPSFRLEKEVIDSEIEVLRELGVEIRCGVEVGKDVTIPELRREGYEAFYLAVGAQKGASLGLAGEELPNVQNGVDYLALANTGRPTGTAGRVIVVGGGNVAIDVARTALREGAGSVDMYCLESAGEMPAAKDEQLEAQAEGIRFHCGWGPKTILSEDGRATGIEFKKCTAVRGADGRFAPQYDESVTETAPAETILLAIGQRIDWGGLLEGTSVETDRGGRAKVALLSWQTADADVFAGGDVVTGPKFAIDAIAAGKEGAISISRLLRGRHLTDGRNAQYRSIETDRVDVDRSAVSAAPRQTTPDVDHAEAVRSFSDLRRGLTEEQIKKEALRCLHCGESVVDADRCIGCGVCTRRCEFDAIHLVRVDDTQSAQNMASWYGRLAGNVVRRGLSIAVNSVAGKRD